MQARKCRKQIYVFTFLSVTVRKAKFRRKFLSHILKPCGRHRADSESVACHVPCVFGVTVITVILGKCVRGGGGNTSCALLCVITVTPLFPSLNAQLNPLLLLLHDFNVSFLGSLF